MNDRRFARGPGPSSGLLDWLALALALVALMAAACLAVDPFGMIDMARIGGD